MSGWTLEREDILKRLYCEGHSASIIAARITVTGFSVTRNAVIGKAHRLGLVGTAPRANPRGHLRVKRSTSPKINPWSGAVQRKSAKIFAAEPFVPGPELVIPLAERRTIATLEAGDCKWPIGDPQHADFHFCGKAQVMGLPYCEHHTRRAYQPPASKNRPINELRFRTPVYGDVRRGFQEFVDGEAPINTREKQDA